MNKLVIIGNGFDLAHGLKTRYNDFIVWYLNKVLKSFRTNSIFEDDLLIVKNYNLRQFNDINSVREFLIIMKNYDDLEIKYKNNFFQLLLTQFSEFNWVDIEFKYYSHLLIFYKALEESKINKHTNIDIALKELNFCFQSLKIQLREYLNTLDLNEVNTCQDIENHFKSQINIKKNDTINKIHLLNFNYTSTIELYTHCFEPNSFKVNYIHGKLNDSLNPLIFGYGDEMDTYYEKIERLNTNEFLRFIKSFGYFKTNNYKNLLRFIDSNYFSVSILGHSCGISDRILLNSIFEHEYCHEIKIYYHKKSDTENDFFEKTQEISRHFKAEKKGEMRKKIVPFSECSPLVK